MSYVEIFPFNQAGICMGEKAASVRNSWLGAMSIWVRMEEKYLPPYSPPGYPSADAYEIIMGHKPTRVSFLFGFLDDPEISAVGWNATSVSCDTWANGGELEADGERGPYNFMKQDKHWWLFDELPQS